MTTNRVPAVNHALRDPLQASDSDVFVLDQVTGDVALVGRFTAATVNVRNTSQPYTETNQKTPRLLDGQTIFEWTLQRGLVDTELINRTYGHGDRLTRGDRFGRHPRFSIVIEFDAGALVEAEQEIENSLQRKAKGKITLIYAKTDNLTMGIDSSQNAPVAAQWEGMAEGAIFTDIESGTADTTVSGDPGSVENTNANTANDEIESAFSFGGSGNLFV